MERPSSGRSASNRRPSWRVWSGRSDIPVEIVHRPTVTTPDGIRRACLEASADDACIGVIGWMHTFSPAKMWIAGLQALQQALPAPPHAVRSRPALRRHRHDLHEPQPVGARRPRVRLHRVAAAHAAQDHRRPLARARRPGAHRHLDARGGRRPRGAAAQGRALRGQHARGGRHRRRQGGSPGTHGHLRATRTASTTWSTSSRRWPMRMSSGSAPSTTSATTSSRSCAPAATVATPCATPPASSWACAPSSPTAASVPSSTPSRTSAVSSSCPASVPSG